MAISVRGRLLSIVCGLCVFGVALKVWSLWSIQTPEQLLAGAQAAILNEDYSLAEDLIDQIPLDSQLWIKSRFIAGDSATRAGRYEDAIRYYQSVPNDDPASFVRALVLLAQAYQNSGQLFRAVECYSRAVDLDPRNDAARVRLAFLLGATGQRWSILPHYLALVRRQAWTLEQLVLLADLERPHEQGRFLRQCEEKSPDDVYVRLGRAAHLIFEGKTTEGQQLLMELVRDHPELTAGQAILGELLVNDTSFLAWHSRLPAEADADPDIWFVRGLWFRQQAKLQPAARCFWESIRIAPSHRRSSYHLGQCLELLGDDAASVFLQRAADLSELTQLLDTVLRSGGRDEKSFEKATRLLKDAGRMWECWAWATTASSQFPQSDWPREIVEDVAPLLRESTDQTLPSANLARIHSFAHWKLPDGWRTVTGGADQKVQQFSQVIQFEDEAEQRGLRFQYFNGDVDTSQRGTRMFEQTGGGPGVIDFDCDGSPDLFFSQGTRWPTGSRTPQPDGTLTDGLFRNADGRRFVDVSLPAGVVDEGFGQGVSIGDFDNDGFPDIYVANVGRNQLYHNNGDGTFTDITETSGLQLADWTTSCLIADLNQDGNPDLFDVNYLDGPDVFVALCNGYGCSPENFDGVRDRLLISRGDGTFEPIESATPEQDSKGMGVVGIELGTRGRPSLFISNDQVPNFFLRNVVKESHPGVSFQNEAFLAGLAYNEDGLAMACMGIAVGDADGDGFEDLFVTNFRDESNTLYLQDASGLFIDSTKGAGLTGPGIPYVGWGTQFLDADLDGHEDLIVVNGHIDDYRSTGEGYHMPAQFFRNTGNGRFVEIDSRKSGSFFQDQYLGRGLARLDWNQDGRMEFAVSNMNSPAVLTVNRTENCGHFLNVSLQAVHSARDALGAVILVRVSGREIRKRLAFGGGYMASNQRLVQFGLGEIDEIESLTIEWPSGHTVSVKGIPVDVTLSVVEDSSEATLWRGRRVEAIRIP